MNLINFKYSGHLNRIAKPSMRDKLCTLKEEVMLLPQYEPITKHYFHAGMYCREVWRKEDVIVIGKVHKKEHFYFIVSGTLSITDGDNEPEIITGPKLLMCKPGTQRAVTSITEALCMTFHVVTATTVEEAEKELVEEEENEMYAVGNQLKNKLIEVLL